MQQPGGRTVEPGRVLDARISLDDVRAGYQAVRERRTPEALVQP